MPTWVLILLIAIVAIWFLWTGFRAIWDCVGVDEWDDETKP